MKAVLEFTYPEDENKLKYALRGEQYYLALSKIEEIVENPQKFSSVEVFIDTLEDILSVGLDERI